MPLKSDMISSMHPYLSSILTSPEGRDEKQLVLKSSTSVHAGTWVPTHSSSVRGV